MGRASAPPDPTVAALLPARSTGRNLVLAVAAVAVLAGAWWSPVLLRPEVESLANGTWTVSGPDGDVVAVGEITAREGPSATVVDVSDVPGARVVAAWLAPERDLATEWPTDVPAADVARNLGAEPLPARVDGGRDALLVVHWLITDCSALSDDVGPELTLRGTLGTTTTVRLDPLLGPAFDLPTLEDERVCPRGTVPNPDT